jgi:hypothetical protein
MAVSKAPARPRSRSSSKAAVATAKPKATPKAPTRKATAKAAAQVRIRMYRLGIGDCFMLSLPRRDGTPFRMLVDCGIHAAEPGGADRIRAAVQDIDATFGGGFDIVVGTHEHWDHLSGFLHAQDIFRPGAAAALWCAWTEDLRDPVARSLLGSRELGVAALWDTVRHLAEHQAYGARPGNGDPPRDWDGVIGFFGDSPGIGPKAKAAAEAMRRLLAPGGQVTYHAPGEPPFDAVSDDWRIFVLGPPRDPAALKKADPAAHGGEAYPLSVAELAMGDMAAASLSAAIDPRDEPPFDRRYAIGLEASQDLAFFRDHYWADAAPDDDATGDAAPGVDQGQAWRRIGFAWLDGAEALALKLDRITNNTSLVLALEIGPAAAKDNPVLLFAADAQIGNWLTWAGVTWPDYHGRQVTGADLLRRTVVYKVGHHASHNATLMDGGLEAMRKLRLAMVPTSVATAGSVGWGTLPWPSLLDRLGQLTGDRVLRSDLGASPGTASIPGITVKEDAAWFDITLPLDLKLDP